MYATHYADGKTTMDPFVFAIDNPKWRDTLLKTPSKPKSKESNSWGKLSKRRWKKVRKSRGNK